MDDSKVKLTGLWKNTSKNGKEYYKGSLTYSSDILIYLNENKRNEKDPDATLYIVTKKPKADGATAPSAAEDAPF